MSAQYATVVGFVQFDPAKKDVNGQTIFEAVVRTVGTGQPLVKVTLWPEFAAAFDSIKKGTFLAADGKYSQNTGTDGKTYHNLSASALMLGTPVEKVETTRSAAVPAAGTVAPF